MEIRSVTLTNFKVHADRFIEFCPGTNAICGENGAGKTSILEAIAWTLFDHSDYTRSELIRAGAKSAQVVVSFISNLDERVYDVRRCTNRGYQVYDPQLKLNLEMRKLEDIQAWMRQHLGLAPNLDLRRLFAETIGIPQGTFTADFLKRPADRKKIFDPILKVEEYKQAYDQTRDLETYARLQVTSLEQSLASFEQQLADWDSLKQQAADLETAIAQDQQTIDQVTRTLEQQQTEVDRLTVESQRIQALEAQVRQLETQRTSKAETLQILEKTWLSAQKAVEICKANRQHFQDYQAAQDALKQINDQRQQRQAIEQQRDRLLQQIQAQEVTASQVAGQLQSLQELRQEVERWQQRVPQQNQLEQALEQVRQALQTQLVVETQRQGINQQIQQLNLQQTRLEAELEALSQLATQVVSIPELEAQQEQLQLRYSQLQAGRTFIEALQPLVQEALIHRDRHQQDILTTQEVLQRWNLTAANRQQLEQVLAAGLLLTTQLLEALQALITGLLDGSAVAEVTIQLQQLKAALAQARQTEQRLAMLPTQQQQLKALQAELQQLTQRQADCDRQLSASPAHKAEEQRLLAALQQLNDPKGQVKVLLEQLRPEPTLQKQQVALQNKLQKLQQQMQQVDAQRLTFADLDAQTAQHQQQLQQLQADYQLYLRHREEANKFRILDPQYQATQKELETIQSSLAQVQSLWETACQTHDPNQLPQMQAALIQQRQYRDQLLGGLQPKQEQLTALQATLQQRAILAEQQQSDRQTLHQRQQTLQFIVDARRIFNQSGPRITQYYLSEVSVEADKLYRELLNRHDTTLSWTEDYDILVHQQGHDRSFRSLSGGEQMCAALAVRLALLKVLADIDIAFFDEPTTNMDQVRRQQLAEAIGNLKTFRQLIVISHDDTFEPITEHLIRVERP